MRKRYTANYLFNIFNDSICDWMFTAGFCCTSNCQKDVKRANGLLHKHSDTRDSWDTMCKSTSLVKYYAVNLQKTRTSHSVQ